MVTSTRSIQATRSRTIISSSPLGDGTSTTDNNTTPNINEHRTTQTVDILRRSTRKNNPSEKAQQFQNDEKAKREARSNRKKANVKKKNYDWIQCGKCEK